MKKNVFFSLLSLSFLATGCSILNFGGNSSMSSSTSSNSNLPNVSKIEVSGYDNKIGFLGEFDTSNVTVEVTFDDDSVKVFDDKDLTFDLSNYNSKTLGKQSVDIKINDLDKTTQIEVEIIPKESLNILMIGNSFSDDTSQWVNEICQDLGIDVNIGNLYIGGCSLDTHFNNLLKNSGAYEYRTYNSTTKSWQTRSNTSIKAALTSYDWEYVSLQQVSGQSGIEGSYSNLDALMELILDIRDDIKFVWNMTWAYQQNSSHQDFFRYNKDQNIMYKSILNLVQTKILPNELFKTVIPNATSIQNARTSFIGDNLTRDGYHLSYDFGRFIAGLTLVKSLTGASIDNVTYAPLNMASYYVNIAIESANNAFNNPYEVTNSTYNEEPVFDMTNYVEINYMPIGGAYYNSNDKNNYNKLVTTASNSLNFVASKKFTRDELPNGTIIEIKSGYQYRPEGWVNDEVQLTRPNNTSTRYVEVNDEWWGNYTIRAFNISATNGGSLVGKLKEAVNAFSLYAPIDSNINLSNPFEIDDTDLFKNNDLDINDYSKYNYLFRNGFYNSSLGTSFEIEYSSEFATKFICTELFNKESLPVGSILVVDEDYQYRPDGWVDDALTENRPSNVKTNFVVIDDDWWGEFTIRGINIAKIGGAVINQNPYEAASHFRIYIPN